jgi:hypothetical protein
MAEGERRSTWKLSAEIFFSGKKDEIIKKVEY